VFEEGMLATEAVEVDEYQGPLVLATEVD